MAPVQAGSSTILTKKSFSGQALVEFALLSVLFVFLVMAVVDVARMFHAQITITNAAREGARYATMELNLQDGLDGTEITDIRQRAQGEASESKIEVDPARVTVTCSTSPCRVTSQLTVQIEYEFDFLTTFWTSDTLLLRKAIEMMVP